MSEKDEEFPPYRLEKALGTPELSPEEEFLRDDFLSGEMCVVGEGKELLRKMAALPAEKIRAFVRGPRRPPRMLVGYGFVDREGRKGSWQFSPQAVFRALDIYVWQKGQASVVQLLFSGEEQIVAGGPIPALVFSTHPAPIEFLDLYAPEDAPREGDLRVVLSDLPGHPYLAASLHFPTLEVGGTFELRWEGELEALFVCGDELLEAEARDPRPEARGSEWQDSNRDSLATSSSPSLEVPPSTQECES